MDGGDGLDGGGMDVGAGINGTDDDGLDGDAINDGMDLSMLPGDQTMVLFFCSASLDNPLLCP